MIIPETIADSQSLQGDITPTEVSATEEEVRQAWIRESKFGRWFLSTNVWFQYVLSQAVTDLRRLTKDPQLKTHTLLDAGCGRGFAFPLLEEHFQPENLIGVDIDEEELEYAAVSGARLTSRVNLVAASITHLQLPDDSVDVIFCHQLLHHVAHQREVLREFYRVLKPGGLLLVSESCRSFIRSFVVKTFFRHPAGVQKSPEQYIDLVQQMGFHLSADSVEISTPYWSRSDFGLSKKLQLPELDKEATEVLIAARK